MITFLTLLTLLNFAAPDTLEAAVPDTAGAAVPDTAAKAKGPVFFTRGSGVVIDTLDVGDEIINIVLRDDGTWSLVRNLEKLGDMDVFTDHWSSSTINPWAADVKLTDLPLHATIILDDSLSTWTCPYQTKVFSKFGYRHRRRHQGIDLPYPKGTPVKAAFDGRVRWASYSNGYGKLVIIRHENGLETFYGHLSEYNVEVGQWVHSGDVIGLGGSTGRSTGPHLHFETRYRGFAFDPEWIADYETGKLRKNVFVLKRTYLDPSSHYVPESLDEEDDVFGGDEEIAAEEARREAERKAMRYHTVRNGETVSGIAIKEGVSIAKIRKLNPGINIDKIGIGQKLRVN